MASSENGISKLRGVAPKLEVSDLKGSIVFHTEKLDVLSECHPEVLPDVTDTYPVHCPFPVRQPRDGFRKVIIDH